MVAAISTEAPPFRATSGDLPVLPLIRLELGAEPDTVVGAAPSIGASAVGRAGRGTRGGHRFRRGSRAADDGGGGDQFQGRAAGEGLVQRLEKNGARAQDFLEIDLIGEDKLARDQSDRGE